MYPYQLKGSPGRHALIVHWDNSWEELHLSSIYQYLPSPLRVTSQISTSLDTSSWSAITRTLQMNSTFSLPVNKVSTLKVVWDTLKYTVYQVFTASTYFLLHLHEYQSTEKCNCVNLTHSCKYGRFQLSFVYRKKFNRVDLIHAFRVEITEKAWRVNNLIYSIKDERTFRLIKNHRFKNFKIYNICHQNV